MSERFPGIDWYCDRCGAGLNPQAGFDDYRYTWPCEECGHKNSISSGNIYESHDDYQVVADESQDESGESLSVWDAADIWLSNGKDEDYMFGYSGEELQRAADGS